MTTSLPFVIERVRTATVANHVYNVQAQEEEGELGALVVYLHKPFEGCPHKSALREVISLLGQVVPDLRVLVVARARYPASKAYFADRFRTWKFVAGIGLDRGHLIHEWVRRDTVTVAWFGVYSVSLQELDVADRVLADDLEFHAVCVIRSEDEAALCNALTRSSPGRVDGEASEVRRAILGVGGFVASRYGVFDAVTKGYLVLGDGGKLMSIDLAQRDAGVGVSS